MSNKLARAKASVQSARSKAHEMENAVVGKVVAYGTGSGIAYAERKGMPLAIGGMPTKLLLGLAGAVGELMTKGASRRFLANLSTAALATHGYNAVRTGSFVAGIDDADGVAGLHEVSGGEL
jgi:hypothetical protein